MSTQQINGYLVVRPIPSGEYLHRLRRQVEADDAKPLFIWRDFTL